MLLALALVSVLSAEPLKASPCLAPKASPKVKLVTIPEGAELTYGTKSVTARESDEPVTACLDGERVVVMAWGLAVELRAKSVLPPSAQPWKAVRAHVKDDSQQVGCLKKLMPGTVLYDRADGDAVGLVIEPALYGAWGGAKTASASWAMLKTCVQNVCVELWIKDDGKSWCPP